MARKEAMKKTRSLMNRWNTRCISCRRVYSSYERVLCIVSSRKRCWYRTFFRDWLSRSRIKLG